MLCFGPNRGRNVTYTNAHRWLPGFEPDDRDAALRTLVTRYLHELRHAAASLAVSAAYLGDQGDDDRDG